MDLKQFALEAARIFLGNAWNRTSSALALIGASALTGWVDQLAAHMFGFRLEQTATWIGFAVMLLGVGMLAYGAGKAKPEPNPHDVQLFHRFEKLIKPGLLSFLREHSFGQTWHRDRLSAIEDLEADWRDARHEFHDPQLQAALEEVLKEADALESKLGLCSYTHDTMPGCFTVYTRVDERQGPQPATLENIRVLNDTARRLRKAISKLLRLGRSKISPEAAK